VGVFVVDEVVDYLQIVKVPVRAVPLAKVALDHALEGHLPFAVDGTALCAPPVVRGGLVAALRATAVGALLL
jgi:hypothetical protein